MAENTDIVRLRLELEDMMSSKLKSATADMNAQLNGMKQQVTQSRSAFGGLADDWKGGFASAMKGAVAGFVGFAVIGKTIGFLKDARQEYKEAQQGLSQLKTALGGSTQALEEQADALGKKLVIDNDEVIALQAQLAMYVKDEEQIKKLTPAVMDLAAAKGMSLTQAAQMVARAVGDDSEELGKLKIKVDGARGSMERTTSIVEGLSGKFGGQAEVLGRHRDVVESIGVKWGNLKEDVGKGVTAILAGIKAIANPSNANAFYEGLGMSDLEIAETKIKALKEELSKPFVSGTGEYGVDIERTKEQTEALQKELKIQEGYASYHQNIIAKKKKDADAQSAKDLKADADKKAEDAKKEGKQKSDAWVTAQEAIINAQSDFNKSVILATMDGIDQKYMLEMEQYNRELELAKLHKENLLTVEYNHIARTKELDQEKTDNATKHAQDIIDSYTDDATLEFVDARNQEEVKKNEERTRRIAEIDKAQYSNKMNLARGTVGILEQMANKNKAWANAYKAAAIATTTVDTYMAAQKAYLSQFMPVPDPSSPIRGAIAAGIAVASGALNIATIANQKFATGTPYTSGGSALVGERGQEIVDLPRGAMVRNNYETRNYGGNTVVMNITDTSGNLIDTFVRQIKRGDADIMVQEMFARAGAI